MIRTRTLRGAQILSGIAFASLMGTVAAQDLKLPSGAAFSLNRGPTISFVVVEAATGAKNERLRLDSKTPGVKTTKRTLSTHSEFKFEAQLVTKLHGTIAVEGVLELYPKRSGPLPVHDLIARITKIPAPLAVAALGVDLEFTDTSREEAVVIPVFSGGEYRQPHRVIQVSEPVDTGNAHGVQTTAYYANDGSGLLVHSVDPKGTEPKHFRFAVTDLTRKSFRTTIEYFLPDTDKGGVAVATPLPIRVEPYRFDPATQDGWFVAAKLYRKWLEANATGKDGILERGRLETRVDVPKWMKELDLLITEQYGWFPKETKEPYPLLLLHKFQKDVGAQNVLLALWSWEDRTNDWGRVGTYFPNLATMLQVLALQTVGIRTLGYTNPTSFDVKSPGWTIWDMAKETIEDRNGVSQSVRFGSDTFFLMDPASARLGEWYHVLGLFHSSIIGMSGFFSDAPVTAAHADFRRPNGQERGTSELGYLGFRNIMAKTQAGARAVGRDFVQIHEVAFEWLIPAANGGQGAVGLVSRPYRDDARAVGIPFFQAVYSGYTLFWPADEGLGTQTLVFVPNAYGPFRENNMSRLLAEGFVLGGVLNASELALPVGKLSYELTLDPETDASLRHHKTVLTNLIKLRRAARPWLVYGELLPNCVERGQRVTMTVKRPFGTVFVDQTFNKLAVPTRAYKAKDGSVRIVCANGNNFDAGIQIDVSRLGLSGKTLIDTQTNETFRINPKGVAQVKVKAATGRLLAIQK